MLFVFCRDPLEASLPDRAFGTEVAAVERLGLPFITIDHDALVRGVDADRVVRRVIERDEPALAAYRGWMMTPEQYRALYDALDQKGVRLINTPEQYRHGHHLPENYPVIRGHTPRSVWITGDLGLDRIMESLATFGVAPIVVKDFVKSRKHEWHEACFIPPASNRGSVERVVGRFLELRGDDLEGGLVFREFVEFESVGLDPRSGMPLAEEYRVFWLDGSPVFGSPYWAEGDYRGTRPPIEQFAAIVADVRSRFFAMDLAKKRGGGWMIVELGDGQVSGLPRGEDAAQFYQSLCARWPDQVGRQGSDSRRLTGESNPSDPRDATRSNPDV